MMDFHFKTKEELIEEIEKLKQDHISLKKSYDADLIEHNRAVKSLQESEEKYRALFRDSPDAYLIIKDGVFVDCNPATEVMMRGSRSQIIGQSPSALSPDIQPDGRISSESALNRINEAFQTGNITFEWEHCCLDGSPLFVEVSISAMIQNGDQVLFTTWRDIRKRKNLNHFTIFLHLARYINP